MYDGTRGVVLGMHAHDDVSGQSVDDVLVVAGLRDVVVDAPGCGFVSVLGREHESDGRTGRDLLPGDDRMAVGVSGDLAVLRRELHGIGLAVREPVGDEGDVLFDRSELVQGSVEQPSSEDVSFLHRRQRDLRSLSAQEGLAGYLGSSVAVEADGDFRIRGCSRHRNGTVRRHLEAVAPEVLLACVRGDRFAVQTDREGVAESVSGNRSDGEPDH